jgi:hypothetical protein
MTMMTKSRNWRLAAPLLGAAGVSLLLAGTASATTGVLDLTAQTPRQETLLSKKEVTDVTLTVFDAFNKEDPASVQQQKFASRRGSRGYSQGFGYGFGYGYRRR